jgi:hypothetical protein
VAGRELAREGADAGVELELVGPGRADPGSNPVPERLLALDRDLHEGLRRPAQRAADVASAGQLQAACSKAEGRLPARLHLPSHHGRRQAPPGQPARPGRIAALDAQADVHVTPGAGQRHQGAGPAGERGQRRAAGVEPALKRFLEKRAALHVEELATVPALVAELQPGRAVLPVHANAAPVPELARRRLQGLRFAAQTGERSLEDGPLAGHLMRVIELLPLAASAGAGEAARRRPPPWPGREHLEEIATAVGSSLSQDAHAHPVAGRREGDEHHFPVEVTERLPAECEGLDGELVHGALRERSARPALAAPRT